MHWAMSLYKRDASQAMKTWLYKTMHLFAILIFKKKNNFFLCRLNFYSCLLTHLKNPPSNMTNNIYNYRMLYHLQLRLRNF